MTTITIKDLSENTDLDRKAMQAISGGSRRSGSYSGAYSGAYSGSYGAHAGALRPAGAGPAHPARIVDFRTGVTPRKAPKEAPAKPGS